MNARTPMTRRKLQEEPSLIRTLVTQKLRKLGVLGQVQKTQALQAFTEACGSFMAQHATAERISRGILYVRLVHSTWLQQMTMMKEELLSKIHQQPGGSQIKDVRFLVGVGKAAPQVSQ